MLRRFIEGLCVLALLLVVGAMGAARLWPAPGAGFWWRAAAIAQMPQDFGALDIAQSPRRATPNDALICPESVCQRAKPDLVAPVFAVPAAELRRKVAIAALAEPRTEELTCAADCDKTGRFVQYSALFQFPDTIDVRVVEAGANSSTLSIYSRSVFGYGDFGVNLARVERWLATLHRIIPHS